MLKFERSVLIDAPIEQVWAFHERSDVLTVLTPPWQPVQIVRRQGGLGGNLGIGAESEFRLWLGVLPVPWLARHVECEPPYLFADLQVQGPLVYWLHRHRFEPIAAKSGTSRQPNPRQPSPTQTLLTDAIEYSLPGGSATEALLESWVNARLADMFAYRHQVTQLACESLD